jgi:ABC-2 type transport system permease protein
MKQLLSIEYSKLKKLTSIKVILIVYMCIVPLWMFFMGFGIQKDPTFRQLMGSENALYMFPNVWKFTTYSASYFNILMGVTIVIITCNEISFRTWKQNVIDGLTKREVIVSKMLVVFAMSTIVTVYTALVAFVFGCIYTGISHAFEGIEKVLMYYLQTIGYFSFAFFFAALVRKPAMSIIFFILSFLVESIIGFILNVSVSGTPYQYFPLKVFADLTPIPFFEQLVANSKKGFWIMPLWGQLLLSFFYIFLFFGIAYRVLKKRDL